MSMEQFKKQLMNITQEADPFDEQPFRRGVYKHAIPAIYARYIKNLSVSRTVRRKDCFSQQQLIQVEHGTQIKLEICEE